MGSLRGLGLHLIFVCLFLVAATYTCLGYRSSSVVCSEQERLALLKFKNSVKDHSGIMLSSWVGNDCCVWEGIHCDSLTGTVRHLHLRGNGEGYLGGNEVKSCLAELRHLKYLDLSGNKFEGSRIPKFIGSFKQLSYLNLSYSGFQGIIPHHIGNLSTLKVLDLSSNRALVADDMSWAFGLPSLEHLDLSRVNLSRAHNWDMVLYMVPSLKELSLSDCGLYNADLGSSFNLSRILPNLGHLDLSFNSFKGPVPPFFQNMTSLEFLDLSVFDLSLSWNFAKLLNMIPSITELHLSGSGLHNTHLSSPCLNFSTLSNIQYLDLSYNSVEGMFPSVFTNMSSLRVLDLSGNMLNSSVPIMPNLLELDLSSNQFKQIEHVGIWRHCHLKRLTVSNNSFDIDLIGSPKNLSTCSRYALEWLDLSKNLNGTIPEPLGRLANLRRLDLSGSQLTGPIPESIGRLWFLRVLDLSDNRLTGPIPTFLGRLSKLDLSSNKLNGSIPESLGKLTGLTRLNLEMNRLTGPIPTSIGRLISLQELSLHSNMLNGTVPVSIGQLPKLLYLVIQNNSLEGVVSEAHFANLSMLKGLYTYFNTKLAFNVSREWIPPFQLHDLVLHSCNIGNEFPQWLQNQRELYWLDLSNTKISGSLPTWLRKMPIIASLDLSQNKITGPLTNLPNGGDRNVLGYEQSLYLENNLFNESIPTSLCRWTDLNYLDLSGNRLTGKIPKCLVNMQMLYTMFLNSNKLSGVIPRGLWTSGALQVLNLGDNKLSGNIPQKIGETLTSLVVLRLHKNKLTGKIPGSLCKLSELHILDVGFNMLTGTIPHCLGELNAMINNSILYNVYDEYMDPNENVIQVLKGLDLEYSENLGLLYNMDLSSNRLVGEIPVELTALSMLIGLNLSNNHLSGVIPDSIGNMTKLESLDISRNELTGVIPPSMAALTFLSKLNLSNNLLSGSIPTGHQLQTLDDPSIYVGNKDLCGPPLPNHCSNHEDPTTSSKKKHKTCDEQTEKWLFYVDIMSGFATGFWGVIGVLLFKEWRWKLFMFAEETKDKIYDAVMVRVAKMKRGREVA